MKPTKNKKEIINNKGYLVTHCLLFIVGFLFLFHGVITFYIGVHNIDLGYNIRVINAEYDLKLIDIRTDFQRWDATTMYIAGLNQQRDGFLMSIAGALLFGVSMSSMRFRGEQ